MELDDGEVDEENKERNNQESIKKMKEDIYFYNDTNLNSNDLLNLMEIRDNDCRTNTILKDEPKKQQHQDFSNDSNQTPDPLLSENADYNMDCTWHNLWACRTIKPSLRQYTSRVEAENENFEQNEGNCDEEANIDVKMQSSREQPKGIKSTILN